MSDLFDPKLAPPWLLPALSGSTNVVVSLRTACRTASLEELRAAHDAIHPHYPNLVEVIEQALEERRNQEADQASERRHVQSLEEARYSRRLAIWAIVIAFFALAISVFQFLGWRF